VVFFGFFFTLALGKGLAACAATGETSHSLRDNALALSYRPGLTGMPRSEELDKV
jgi:hypothetical protein